MKRPLAVLALLALVWAGQAMAAGHVFVVQSDQHLEFAREICLAALKAAGLDASFEPFPVAPEKRLDAEMASGKLHLAFIPPNGERLALEKDRVLAAIRFPLERGLLGYRVCLVRGSEEDILKDVTDVQGLKRFTVGQGLGWGDIEVYRSAGFKVVEAPFASPADPLRSLAAGLFDLLPLGASEYRTFLTKYNLPHLPVVADRHVLLRYPWFRYVWVSLTAPEAGLLLDGLRRGLNILAENGEFLRIYEKYKGHPGERILEGRRVIDLPSPYPDESVDPRYLHLLIDPR